MSRRVMVIAINAVLILAIIGLITATWMPVIYSSAWFHRHFLK